MHADAVATQIVGPDFHDPLLLGPAEHAGAAVRVDQRRKKSKHTDARRHPLHASGPVPHVSAPRLPGHSCWTVHSTVMQLFGVCNASPDSLNNDSIVRTAANANERINLLLAQGCFGFDVGGQGSTFAAEEVDPEVEWQRLAAVLPTFVATGCPVSVDTWRPTVARRALEMGVTWLNAADGMQTDEMYEVAAEFACPIVLPFMHGPDPLRLTHIPVGYDPVQLIVEWFEEQLKRADRFGVRKNCVIDPGTGFAPHGWDWEDRFLYQKQVYSRIDELRTFGLPVYIALPWKDTAQHRELLDIVISHDPDYGRTHYPDRVRLAEQNHAR